MFWVSPLISGFRVTSLMTHSCLRVAIAQKKKEWGHSRARATGHNQQSNRYSPIAHTEDQNRHTTTMRSELSSLPCKRY